MLQHLILWKDYRYTREWIRNIPRQWKYKTLVDGRWTFENGSSHPEKAKIGTADFLMGLENKRAIKVSGKSTIIGLGVAIFAGACFSLFSPAFNLATNDQWHTMKAGVPHLVVYTAFFYFTLSWFIISIILTMSFLYNPIFKLFTTDHILTYFRKLDVILSLTPEYKQEKSSQVSTPNIGHSNQEYMELCLRTH
ncbi:hypothetical protein NE237_023515 [Protea cynaroides]|uniref:Uncharacterized protein n=1 Tax=Protea cynaroides TaxID=273540 RepID=A0A9Q0HBM6_9MAGN|nr:hypothetical protein NE237_023515 [Protea cynaroides]